MEKATIIELVLWKPKAGISNEDMQTSISALNNFVKDQPGFISRKTALAEDGQFLDFVLWTDLNSAKVASEKAMKNEQALEIFGIIEEEGMLFKHYEIFNELD